MLKLSTPKSNGRPKSLLALLFIWLFLNQSASAHSVDSYSSSCAAGPQYSVTAVVSTVNSTSNYRWQWKNNSGAWVCFANGSNTINGNAYTVSGAVYNLTTTPGSLVFTNPNSGLQGLEIRMVISDGSGVDPCTLPSGNTWTSTTNHFINISGTPCATGSACSGRVISLYFNELSGGADLPITNGSTFSVAQLGSLYNLEAGTSGTIGSVKYTITGPTPSSNIENTIPYNNPTTGGGAWTGAVGTYSVNLKTYNGADGSGTLCHDTTITFNLTTTLTGSIGDRVWLDANGNGIQDASETTGITGVTVQLRNSANTVIATQNTNASGNYLFAGLAAGTYTVVFPVSINGAVVTVQNVGVDDNIDSDPSQSTGITGNIVLSAGQNIVNVDAGFCPTTLQLGNRVFNDINNNGIDNSEPGIPGETVLLYKDDNNDNVADGASIATTITNSTGNYVFTNLSPGNYIVGIVTPAGFSSSVVNGGDPDNNTDLDDNGQITVGAETRGLAITLTGGAEPDGINTNTNINVTYDFGFVCSLPTPVVTVTNPTCTLTTGTITITAVSGLTYCLDGGAYSATLVYSGLAAGSNHTIGSKNASGCISPLTSVTIGALLPVPDAPVIITSNPTCTVTTGTVTITAVAGLAYSFDGGAYSATLVYSGLITGSTHTVTAKNASGCISSSSVTIGPLLPVPAPPVVTPANPTCTVTTGTATISAVAGLTFSFDGGAYSAALIYSGLTAGSTHTVTAKSVAGCISSPTSVTIGPILSVPVSGITGPRTICAKEGALFIAISAGVGSTYDWTFANGIPATATGSSAAIQWNLPGEYAVHLVVTKGGCTASYDTTIIITQEVFAAAGPDGTICRGSNITLNGTGPLGANFGWTVVSGDPTSIDLGANQSGVLVSPVVTTTFRLTVTQNGCTRIDDITVFVNVNMNPVANAGSNTTVCASVPFVIGGNPTGTPPVLTPLATLGYSWSPATGLNSTTIANPILTLTTPGTYTYQVIVYSLSTGCTDTSRVQIIVQNCASIGDKVWIDNGTGTGGTANDGLQNGTEPGVAGIGVTLYNATGAIVGSTTTDAYGNYLFNSLPAGNYTVGFTLPVNYGFTTQTNTSDDGNTTGTGAPVSSQQGSDVNPLTGKTYTVVLSGGENNRNIDAGLIFIPTALPSSIGDRVWLDTNGNGNQDTGEPGVSGVTVTLYDDVTGNVLAVTTTDANGNYIFNNLPNGTYKVGFSAPGGTLLSPNVGGTTPGNITTNSDPDPATGKTTTITISTPGTLITGIDAGLKYDVKGAIGDFVWNDINRNGIQDANETGIPGVTMQLYTPGANNLPGGGDDVLIGTTTTDAKGYYIFPNLNLGKYFVVATPPAGYAVSPVDIIAGNPEEDTKDCDFVPNGEYPGKQVSHVTILTTTGLSSRDMTIDMGLYNTTDNLNSVGDKVWNDVNGNGLQDIGEPAVANITVRLLNGTGTAVNNPATGKPYTTTTNADGIYRFGDLADGNYIVEFANIPAGFSLTKQDASGTGNPGSVTDGNNDSDPKTTTGRTGVINLDAAGSNPLSVNLVNVDAGIQQGISAGTVSLGNRVWYDLNNNGLQDAGELGVANVRAELLDAAGTPFNIPLTATPYIVYTNALGEYIFTGLPAGDYKVRFGNFPAGFTSSPADFGTNDAIDADANFAGVSITATTIATTGTNTLQTGEDNLTVDMGIVPPSTGSNNTLGNFVWNDQNSDGRQNIEEPGIAGVNVQLYSNGLDGIPGSGDDVLLAVTTTDSLGRYQFVGLPDGNYNVGFANLPAGFTFTTQNAAGTSVADGSDANATTGRSTTVALDPTGISSAGIVNNDIDAGLVTTRAALGNYVWIDSNGDGVQDAIESGVSGVTVTLYSSDGTTIISSTITDAYGKYYFGNLTPGSYVAGFGTIPSNLGFTKQNTPGDNQNNSNSDAIPATGKTGIIVLSAGEVDLTIDAGLQPNNFASVGDFVWVDLDRNGVQDVTEPGVPGVLVTLYNAANAVVGAAVTDGNGKYLINNVPAGIGYYIGFSNTIVNTLFTTQTSNVTPGDATKGSDANITTGKTAPFNLTTGQYLPTVDAGLIKIINIYGNVWHDVNGLTNLEINPTPGATPIPNAMNVYLVDISTGLIVQAESILLDGTFSFLDVDVNRSYKVVLSSAVAFVGDASPIATLPSGWQRVGENLGRGPLSGSDGVPNGLLFLDTTTGDVIDADFGIRLKNGEVIIG